MKNKLVSAGALWEKTSKSDNRYYSGILNLRELLGEIVDRSEEFNLDNRVSIHMQGLAKILRTYDCEDLNLLMFVNDYRQDDYKDPAYKLLITPD